MKFAELILTVQNSVKMLSTLQLISHALPQIVPGSLFFCSKSKTNKQENPTVKVCQVHLPEIFDKNRFSSLLLYCDLKALCSFYKKSVLNFMVWIFWFSLGLVEKNQLLAESVFV